MKRAAIIAEALEFAGKLAEELAAELKLQIWVKYFDDLPG